MTMPTGENEDRAKTRERFNEVFRRYTEGEKKKQKKTKAETQETIVLQNLKKKLNLDKDTGDDETILQNTFDPDQGSPRFTKNQRREREVAQKVNVNNNRNQEEQKENPKRRRRRRELPSVLGAEEKKEQEEALNQITKKGWSKGQDKVNVEEAEDQLLQEYQQQIVQEEERMTRRTNEEERTSRRTEEERKTKKTKVETIEENTTSPKTALNNETGKKNKKKLKSLTTYSHGGDPVECPEQKPEEENDTETKAKKKKKKKKHIVTEDCETEAEVFPRPVFDDKLVLGVYIHRTDRLKTHLLISHPMVKIHVVDENTGQYVKKEDSHRSVSSFYEHEKVSHILPIMTLPFDFKKNKSIIPEWQEQIIFNERFGYFVEQSNESPRVLLFFEILDFVSMEEVRAHINTDRHEGGFRKIAWAFLKLVGSNGMLNIDAKLRLQLFCPPPRATRDPKSVEVVEWWRKYPRHKYNSTLYVTVKGIQLPQHVDPSVRSMMALQEERGSTSYSELQEEVTRRRCMSQTAEIKEPTLRWSRLPGQVCRIPNRAILSLRGGHMGCFTLLFSHSGTKLAAACADRDAFPVIVYEIPSGKVLAAFTGHLKIIYDLCWSTDDTRLLSASSDGTVREWDIEGLSPSAQTVLPHPSFVYCAKLHPSAQTLVVTGGYDSVVRVWSLDMDHVNGQLLQEFEGHSTFINTLCFDSEGRRMFSADNAGLIIVWKTWVNDSKCHQPCQHWCIEKRIDEIDLVGVPINMLQLHPNGRGLLIHAKDSALRMMDLRILAVQKYTGATNCREKIYSTFSPCGTLIFSGSEDGVAYVWNTETGHQVAAYMELFYRTALHSVTFHPHENMVAFCAFGQSQPIHIYLYDHKVSQLEVQNIKGLSGAGSVDIRAVRNTPDPLLFQDSSVSSAMDQFTHSTRLTLKLQCVKEQLDSVLEPHHRSSASGFIYDRDKTGISHALRSLTLDTGRASLSASLPPPSHFSPHSKMQLLGSGAEQQPPPSIHSRGFSPVGQPLRGASPFRQQRQTLPGHLSPDDGDGDVAPVQQTVVCLYDYTANRSDELSVRCGDIIHVLYKDNDSWWFGCCDDGRQGYFLSSYVVDESKSSADAPALQSDGTVDRSTPIRVSAVISSPGELCFLSEPTLSDTEPELMDTRTKRRKKVKKAGLNTLSSQATPSATGASGLGNSTRRVLTMGRPLPQRPKGRSNNAFEANA